MSETIITTINAREEFDKVLLRLFEQEKMLSPVFYQNIMDKIIVNDIASLQIFMLRLEKLTLTNSDDVRIIH
jgi:hypothetical protein